MGEDAVAVFRSCFEGEASMDALRSWLHESVWLAPPTYYQKWYGQAHVMRLLTYADDMFSDLRYERVWRAPDSAVLLFEASVGDLPIRGLEVLTLDEEGLITGIEITARPPNSVMALTAKMIAVMSDDPFFDGMAGESEPEPQTAVTTPPRSKRRGIGRRLSRSGRR